MTGARERLGGEVIGELRLLAVERLHGSCFKAQIVDDVSDEMRASTYGRTPQEARERARELMGMHLRVQSAERARRMDEALRSLVAAELYVVGLEGGEAQATRNELVAVLREQASAARAALGLPKGGA